MLTSFAICFVLIDAQPAARQSFLHFVDLAGCERVKRTGNSGARLRYAPSRPSLRHMYDICFRTILKRQQQCHGSLVRREQLSGLAVLFSLYCCCRCCRESVAINSSLMTLARCLEVLRYNQQHPGDEKVIPYRESKVRCQLCAACLMPSACMFACHLHACLPFACTASCAAQCLCCQTTMS